MPPPARERYAVVQTALSAGPGRTSVPLPSTGPVPAIPGSRLRPNPDGLPGQDRAQDPTPAPDPAPRFQAVGIVWQKRAAVALVQDAEGYGHVVQPGSRLDGGRVRIKAITPCEVVMETTRTRSGTQRDPPQGAAMQLFLRWPLTRSAVDGPGIPSHHVSFELARPGRSMPG